MKNKKRLLLTLMAGAFMCNCINAQETEFDLASQRSENQDVLMVPGRKLDHKELIINPVPHQLLLDKKGELNFSKGIRLKDKHNKFQSDFSFVQLNNKGLSVDVDFGNKVAAKNNVKEISGAYSLIIDKKGVKIVGFDERGAFYGIQTLRQILSSPIASNGTVPFLSVNDYPDLPYRGVVEGFYGTPWSHEVRLSLIDFYGKFKLNSYLYGPKDDPYHSCPNWRQPYPEKEAKNIKELVEACNKNRVDFVWAIHPGQDIKWNEEDYNNLVNKFNLMYDLGVRSFAIFFDDIDGEGTNPNKQTALLNRLNSEFVKTKGDVTSLVVCPTDYSKLWANPTPEGSLSIYGKTLDPSVQVFWTGDVVCSDLTKETMDWVNSRIDRPAYFWWNYPVTDYVRNIIMQGPVYGLEPSLTSKDLCGLASNPMEHGEASKLALYSVADYSWNMKEYNPIDSWERGLVELTPETSDAYRTFAIHSCDTETGYRRSESWETETFRVNKYTPDQLKKLKDEFQKVKEAPSTLREKCVNKALIGELNPWLVEFEKLGIRGENVIKLIELYESGSDSDFWSSYVNNIMSNEDRKSYEAHKSGTMKLQPFYENAMDDMAIAFFKKLTGETPTFYKGVGTYPNLKTTLSKLMFDNDTTTHYTSGNGQKAGDWIGADLGCVRPVSEIEILQGRNSTNDVDYFDNVVLEYSKDGSKWIPLSEGMEKQYVINWKGKPVEARYIRLKRLDSSKKNWAAVRSFKVNPVRKENLPFNVTSSDMDKILYAFDKNPTTSVKVEDAFSYTVPEGKSQCTLLLKISDLDKKNNPMLKQYSKDGKLLKEIELKNDLVKVSLEKNTNLVEFNGKAEIFEIMFE